LRDTLEFSHLHVARGCDTSHGLINAHRWSMISQKLSEPRPLITRHFRLAEVR